MGMGEGPPLHHKGPDEPPHSTESPRGKEEPKVDGEPTLEEMFAILAFTDPDPQRRQIRVGKALFTSGQIHTAMQEESELGKNFVHGLTTTAEGTGLSVNHLLQRRIEAHLREGPPALEPLINPNAPTDPEKKAYAVARTYREGLLRLPGVTRFGLTLAEPLVANIVVDRADHPLAKLQNLENIPVKILMQNPEWPGKNSSRYIEQ